MVRHGSSRSFCSMKPTVGLGPSTGMPLRRIRPSLGRSRPATRLRMVLFPQPDGPTTATNSPARTSRLTCSIAVSADTPSGALKHLVTPASSSTNAVFSIGGIQRSVNRGELLLQHGGGPRAFFARRTFHAIALKHADDLGEVVLTGAKDRFHGIGQRALFGAEGAAQRLVPQPGMKVAHAALPALPCCILNFAFE